MAFGTVSDLAEANEALGEASDALRDARHSIRADDEPELRSELTALIAAVHSLRNRIDSRIP